MTHPLLETHGVTVTLGGRIALAQADATVRSGELTGLIGPNGAGKTTLLRAVLGLVPLSAGRVLVDGRPPAEARRLIGYVPQRHEFAWDFPVDVAGAVLSGRTRQIGWLRRPGPSDRAAAAEALERVGLSALARRPVGELSGGQRQRVLVARALVGDPQLLLLDEPFTGVDVPTQELLTTLLRQLADEGRAVLMSTHDLAAAARICDRLLLLNRTVVGTGGPELLADPEALLRAFGLNPATTNDMGGAQ